MSEHPLSMAFWLIAELCSAHGLAPLNKHRGCVVVEAGAWRITVNGHNRPARAHGGSRLLIPRFTAMVEFNGWPAGSLNPYGGVIAAGEAANEDTLIEALRAEVLRLTGRDVVAEAEEVARG